MTIILPKENVKQEPGYRSLLQSVGIRARDINMKYDWNTYSKYDWNTYDKYIDLESLFSEW